MVRKNFKVGGLDASNVNIRANGFAATLTANADLASNVSFSLPGSTGTSGQVLSTDGSGNLYFSDSSANTQVYVGDTLVSNTSLILEAGSGVSLTTNANSGIVSFSTSMSNVTSQTIAVDGSANSFTLAKSVANSHMVLVSYNGLLQGPEEYSVSDTTLTISNSKPLLSDSKIEVRYFDFFEFSGLSEGGGGGGGTQAQGSVSGYASGGISPTYRNIIDKFPFSADSNATDVGDLSSAVYGLAGQSSQESGYVAGGNSNPSIGINTIEKFPFSVDANTTDVGDLTQIRFNASGQSSLESGYSSGGRIVPSGTGLNTIDKFPFSADANATDVGDLTQGRYTGGTGQSSAESGYNAGGLVVNTIDKFSFSADGNATDVGNLTTGRYNLVGQSSGQFGYATGGGPSTYSNSIEKFPFASDGNAADVGDLTQLRFSPAGQSSTESGYTSGGFHPTITPAPIHTVTIDKFPFASDANATDVGDLTQARQKVAGQQV
jgi:hypothetical protein